MGEPGENKEYQPEDPGKRIVPVVEDGEAVPEEVPLTESDVVRILEEEKKPKKKDDKPN